MNDENSSLDENQPSSSDCRYAQFANIDDSIVSDFKDLMRNGCNEEDIRSDSLIAGSISMALCCILMKLDILFVGFKKLLFVTLKLFYL